MDRVRIAQDFRFTKTEDGSYAMKRDGKKGKACDCSKTRNRKGKKCQCEPKNDSLTPQEYLAACDLKIQDRTRTYIRARLDAKTTIAKGSKASRMGNKGLASDFNRQAGQFAAAKVGLASLQLANKRRKTGQLPKVRNMRNQVSNAAFSAEQRMKGFKVMKRNGNRGWLPDSVWAEGFSYGQ